MLPAALIEAAATTEAEKTWAVLGAIAFGAILTFAARWHGRRNAERRIRRLLREQPELAPPGYVDGDPLPLRRLTWSERVQMERELSSPLDLRPMVRWLAAVLLILVAALLLESVVDSPVAGWIAAAVVLAGLPAAVLIAFVPRRRGRRRAGQPPDQ